VTVGAATVTRKLPGSAAPAGAPETAPAAAPAPLPRPCVRGPALFLGERKFVVKAVTYGTFAADAEGHLYPPPAVVRRDFEMMLAAHVNTVRTYMPPPAWFLDEARRAGLRVLVGIHWENSNCDFDDARAVAAAVRTVRKAVRGCLAYPDVVLAYVIGNEVPPLVTRFHGWRTVHGFLEHLCLAAKEEDPGGLVTYANFPPTEFLQLDFLDFATINVYLRDPRVLGAYLDRLMVEAKGKPLLLGEFGDDAIRQGTAWQAELLDWAVPLALDKGLCGVAVYSWTDDWVVSGHRIDDWAFGLLDAKRNPKPAYEVVRRQFAASHFEGRTHRWPRVSVVVCNYNGAETLDETLTSLEDLDYPDYEVLYVDDGSTDESLEIARRHEAFVRILTHEDGRNLGLSASRNLGAERATGEIVAYIDSDAYADRDWLRHLVVTMERGRYAGAGGPNLTPDADGLTAQFIAMCPGNPTHVLKDAVRADHIAGVNMAFRRDLLLALGGFDPVHRRAGDDVDICWRFEDSGFTLAFSPAAVVWHHRRPSVLRYFQQQAGYGVAENQLERKHPDRFNSLGAIRWSGRVYAAPRRASRLFKPFIYHGPLGTALFQTMYQKEPSYLLDLPTTTPWYAIWALFFALTPLSLWFLPFAAAMFGASVFAAFVAGWTTEMPFRLTRAQTWQKVLLISFVHFFHPLVRSWGRVRARSRSSDVVSWFLPEAWASPDRLLAELWTMGGAKKQVRRYWGVRTADRESVLRSVQRELRAAGPGATFGHEWDEHDLEIPGGIVTTARVYTSPEHYDCALCVGVSVSTSGLAVLLVTLAAAVSIAAAFVVDQRLGFAAAVPAAFAFHALGRRDYLRRRAWAAVEAVMGARGAKRFEPGRAPAAAATGS
jgi:glycosyltransferase involved in cell wall biosynthesis